MCVSQKREPSELKLRVRKEGRMRFLEKKETELLDEKQLEALWPVLCSNCVLPDSADKRVRPATAACAPSPQLILPLVAHR